MFDKAEEIRDNIVVILFLVLLWFIILFLPSEKYDDDF